VPLEINFKLETIMLKQKVKPRNPIVIAMMRANKKTVFFGKTKKADRRQANVDLMRGAFD
jgi:hypothetical protein